LKAYNKYIALFLLAIISAFIVPKELVHELYEHTDTVHSWNHNETGLPALEQEHQHCDLLNFNVPLYFLSLNFFKTAEISFSNERIQQVTEIFFAPHIGLCSLRAPPAC
jgi:hypothetical protein